MWLPRRSVDSVRIWLILTQDRFGSWMEWISTISPATYALRGIRASILDGAGLRWDDVWPLLIIGAACIPLGLAIFRRGEVYAKKHGKLKRSG